MLVNSQWQCYCYFKQDENSNCDGFWKISDAPWRCYSVKEMEIYEKNMESLKKGTKSGN
jgi:hypothetical protein